MQEFLNPKSMLTPGGAGALLMFLVNGIACQFPEIESRYMALVISFLLSGILIISAKALLKTNFIEKALYWALNSCIIFVVGFGSANIASEMKIPNRTEVSSFFLSFVPQAYAQERPRQTGRDEVHSEPSRQHNNRKEAEEMRAMREENERLKDELNTRSKQQGPSGSRSSTGFFRKW